MPAVASWLGLGAFSGSASHDKPAPELPRVPCRKTNLQHSSPDQPPALALPQSSWESSTCRAAWGSMETSPHVLPCTWEWGMQLSPGSGITPCLCHPSRGRRGPSSLLSMRTDLSLVPLHAALRPHPPPNHLPAQQTPAFSEAKFYSFYSCELWGV